jgi:pimeloyl-ACP methyl ester carboxylesterase
MGEINLNVRGRNVTVLQDGEGEPTVYLHGFADVHGVEAAWMPFHRALARATRFIAPAHPGVAASQDLPGATSIEDAVFHYLETFDALGLKRFNLVGHSVGGWIAAEIAVRHPEKVKRLVLLGACGLCIPDSPISDIFLHSQPENGKSYASLRRMLFSSSDAAHALRYYPDGRGELDEEVRRYQMIRFGSFIGFKPPYFYHRDLESRLYRARMPSLVICGALDSFVPPTHAHRYAAALPACMAPHIIAGVGHAAHVEQPDETSSTVLAFLSATP